MRPVVFAGPSLHGSQTKEFNSIDIRPPANCGDVLKAVAEGRKTIGLIDGGFEQGPAVWHKEILEALDRGCAVFGASSMGALRAAELQRFGMIGLGQVFTEYASGQRVSDADVAVIHGPRELGYPPLNLSIVEMEDVVTRLRTTSAFDSEIAELVINTGRSMYFKERTWESLLLRVLDNADQRASIQSQIAALGHAVKTRDAMLLLDTLASTSSSVPPTISYERTTFMSALIQKLDISL